MELDGLSSVLFATLFLTAPTLTLLHRWRVPFGSFSLLFGAVAVLMVSLEGFDLLETALAGVAGGVCADLLVRALERRGVARPMTMRVVGATIPAVMWSTYFAVLTVLFSVGWSVELWAGITVMASLWGFALALLMTLPAVPRPLERDEPEKGR